MTSNLDQPWLLPGPCLAIARGQGPPDGFLVVCALVATVPWSVWYWQLFGVSRLASRQRDRLLLYLAPVLSMGLLFLFTVAPTLPDQKDLVREVVYFLVGAEWIWFARLFVPLLGISARDDVAERRNRAAAYPILGAFIGLTLAFLGVVDGAGPALRQETFGPILGYGILATVAWYALWWLLERLARVSEAITVERDEAAGWRLAGFLVATGLLLGYTFAGQLRAEDSTLTLPHALVLFGLPVGAILVEVWCQRRPSPRHKIWKDGVLPAGVYLGLAWLGLLAVR
jgi:hypothetical protein